ncbi:MAG: endonuclease/exonuclease/phosphatase (EEP) superfamily protein YafD [Mariniblastus sp.]
MAYPVLLAGDLNTTPRIAPHSQADEQGKNAFEEVIRETGISYSPLAKPNSNELTFPSDEPRSTIGWILFNSDAFELVDQTVVPSLLSDHLPVVAEFSIQACDTMGQGTGVARRTGKQE